jgi:hypothetical protein
MYMYMCDKGIDFVCFYDFLLLLFNSKNILPEISVYQQVD